MTRMKGTGNAPQGYMEGQMFDVPEHDQGTVEDLERKGWATRVAPEDDPARSKVSVANAIVRGDMLSDPTEAAIAAEIGGVNEALPIVHTEDENATEGDYEAEVAAGQRDFYGEPIEGETTPSGNVPVALSRKAKASSGGASSGGAAASSSSGAAPKSSEEKK